MNIAAIDSFRRQEIVLYRRVLINECFVDKDIIFISDPC